MIGLKQTNFRTVTMPSSVTELSALIDFLNNKKDYESKLAELKKLTSEANEAIENVGKAKKINDLMLEAEAVNNTAKAEAESMKVKAKSVLKAAEDNAVAILKDAKANALLMTTQAEAIKAGTDETIIQMRKDQELIALQKKDITDRSADLDKREAAVERAEIEAERKRKVLSQL